MTSLTFAYRTTVQFWINKIVRVEEILAIRISGSNFLEYSTNYRLRKACNWSEWFKFSQEINDTRKGNARDDHEC